MIKIWRERVAASEFGSPKWCFSLYVWDRDRREWYREEMGELCNGLCTETDARQEARARFGRGHRIDVVPNVV